MSRADALACRDTGGIDRITIDPAHPAQEPETLSIDLRLVTGYDANADEADSDLWSRPV